MWEGSHGGASSVFSPQSVAFILKYVVYAFSPREVSLLIFFHLKVLYPRKLLVKEQITQNTSYIAMLLREFKSYS